MLWHSVPDYGKSRYLSVLGHQEQSQANEQWQANDQSLEKGNMKGMMDVQQGCVDISSVTDIGHITNWASQDDPAQLTEM